MALHLVSSQAVYLMQFCDLCQQLVEGSGVQGAETQGSPEP